jgi:hypothetical protein
MPLLALVAAVALAAPLKATLSAPTHKPKIGVKWFYTVRATVAGKPAAAKLTAQIVDPLGGKHAVQYRDTKKNIVNWPFKGRFRDYVIWTADSAGFPLSFRVKVTTASGTRTLNYVVTPRK